MKKAIIKNPKHPKIGYRKNAKDAAVFTGFQFNPTKFNTEDERYRIFSVLTISFHDFDNIINTYPINYYDRIPVSKKSAIRLSCVIFAKEISRNMQKLGIQFIQTRYFGWLTATPTSVRWKGSSKDITFNSTSKTLMKLIFLYPDIVSAINKELLKSEPKKATTKKAKRKVKK